VNSGDDELMIDLIKIIKEDRLDREQSSAILQRHRYRNYENLSREIKSVEAQFLVEWQKLIKDSTHVETFLCTSAHLAMLYLEYSTLQRQISKVIRAMSQKQTRLRFTRLRLESKYENTNEIIQSRMRLHHEKNDLYNRRVREESKIVSSNIASQSKFELKITKREFLEMYSRYIKNSTLRKEFIQCSDRYAVKLLQRKTQQEKIRAWRKTKPYNQMLRENYIKYSILEHKLLDSVNYS
jgi:hypothetical protein